MKYKGLVGLLVLVAGVSFAQAQPQDNGLHGSIDVTYTSKYIWRGFDVFANGHSAIHPSIDLNLFNTGFGLSATGHRANSTNFENGERWDYSPYYQNSLFNGEAYKTDYRVSYVYYNYPDSTSHTENSIDLQEVNAMFSWPELLGVKGLVPSYCIVKLWPSNSNTLVGARSTTGGTASGFAHIFMLDYALPMCPWICQPINLHAETVYNDGVSPNGQSDVDHDFSHAVFGASTTFDITKNLAFTPGVYYQSSWEKSVNDEDEFWVSAGMKYKF